MCVHNPSNTFCTIILALSNYLLRFYHDNIFVWSCLIYIVVTIQMHLEWPTHTISYVYSLNFYAYLLFVLCGSRTPSVAHKHANSADEIHSRVDVCRLVTGTADVGPSRNHRHMMHRNPNIYSPRLEYGVTQTTRMGLHMGDRRTCNPNRKR